MPPSTQTSELCGVSLVEYLKGLNNLAVTYFAQRIYLTGATLLQIIDGHAPITFDQAVRLENALGTSRKMWIDMQSAYGFLDFRRQTMRLQPNLEA